MVYKHSCHSSHSKPTIITICLLSRVSTQFSPCTSSLQYYGSQNKTQSSMHRKPKQCIHLLCLVPYGALRALTNLPLASTSVGTCTQQGCLMQYMQAWHHSQHPPIGKKGTWTSPIGARTHPGGSFVSFRPTVFSLGSTGTACPSAAAIASIWGESVPWQL